MDSREQPDTYHKASRKGNLFKENHKFYEGIQGQDIFGVFWGVGVGDDVIKSSGGSLLGAIARCGHGRVSSFFPLAD